ncbi:MAG: hypothetical protein SFV81_08885 [Pirellulaceae bacterium]|nr:hypothetical protein [Pirellulaceae bacterium]
MATNLDSPKENAAEWSQHEHVSSQVQLEAEKLVELVGTPELAKQAISVVEQTLQVTQADSSLASSLARSRQAAAETSAAFLKSLSDLETTLATPVMSGELADWLTNTLRDCERVKSMLVGEVREIHTALFSSILRENVNLSAQVEKLRAEDLRILHSECTEVLATLTHIQSEARLASKDEAKLSEAIASVSQKAIGFVVAARGQETAISTWLSEAFNRDLGSGD